MSPFGIVNDADKPTFQIGSLQFIEPLIIKELPPKRNTPDELQFGLNPRLQELNSLKSRDFHQTPSLYGPVLLRIY